ncbi:MAG: hypothetical protein ACLFO2_04465 [Candidatus Woesearchaeota archaeon]
MSYEPRYTDGELLVKLKGEPVEEAAAYVFRQLSYDLGRRDGEAHDFYSSLVYVVQVPEGEEESVREELEENSMVEWAERRDLRFERRYGALERIIRESEALRDSADECSTAEYNRRLEEFRSYLRDASEDS